MARFNERGQVKARYPPRNMLNAKHKRPPRRVMDWIPTATYDESPFAPIVNTSAYLALKELQHSHRSPGNTTNVLDALRCIYSSMGDRGDVSDPWLQRRVTRPSPSALQNYKRKLCQYQAREKGSPTAPKTLRHVHRNDPAVKLEVGRRFQEAERRNGESEAKAKSRIAGELFQEAELRPGGLEKYKQLVQKDIERYTGELKYFKEVKQRKFDEEEGLLPLPPVTSIAETR